MRAFSHHPFTPLVDDTRRPWGHESRARLSGDQGSRTAIIFVHGLGGHPVDTWLDFPLLLPSDNQYRTSDLYFFGYESKVETAAFSASQLFRFLDALHEAPSKKVINPTRPPGTPERELAFRYQRTIVCAHSLGAIVTRLALVQAGKLVPPRTWPAQLRLVLFAPAHMGASIIPLASRALEVIRLPFDQSAAVLEPLLQSRFPALIDLTPDSQTLRELQTDTRELLSEWSESDCLRAFVTHGQKDRLVRQNTFLSDHPTVTARGIDHFEICKPSRGYRDPLKLLVDAMK